MLFLHQSLLVNKLALQVGLQVEGLPAIILLLNALLTLILAFRLSEISTCLLMSLEPRFKWLIPAELLLVLII